MMADELFILCDICHLTFVMIQVDVYIHTHMYQYFRCYSYRHLPCCQCVYIQCGNCIIYPLLLVSSFLIVFVIVVFSLGGFDQKLKGKICQYCLKQQDMYPCANDINWHEVSINKTIFTCVKLLKFFLIWFAKCKGALCPVFDNSHPSATRCCSRLPWWLRVLICGGLMGVSMPTWLLAACSLDLNPIEKQLGMMTRGVYKNQ